MNLTYHKIRGMVSDEECENLNAMAKNVKKTAVELGSFGGRSAVAIASGLPDGAKLHCFDRFTFTELSKDYRDFVPDQVGSSFRSLFDANTSAYRGKIVVYDRDIRMSHFEDDIEFLHIDCSEGRPLHFHIAVAFFPCVAPGGYLLQQDFFYHRSYYLPGLMRLLGDHFEYERDVETTRIYRCKERVTHRQVLDILAERIDYVAHIRETCKGLDPVRQATLLTQEIFYLKKMGRKKEAAGLGMKIMETRHEQVIRDNISLAMGIRKA